jgi:hypothetical protein
MARGGLGPAVKLAALLVRLVLAWSRRLAIAPELVAPRAPAAQARHVAGRWRTHSEGERTAIAPSAPGGHQSQRPRFSVRSELQCVTEASMCTSVIRTAWVTATGIEAEPYRRGAAGAKALAALFCQELTWALGQPFSHALADRVLYAVPGI